MSAADAAFLEANMGAMAPGAGWGAGEAAATGAAGASASDIALMGDLGGKTLTPWDWTKAGLLNGDLGYAAAAAGAGLGVSPAVSNAVGSALGSGAGDIVKAGVALAGGIAGAEPTGGGTTTTKRELDPRIDAKVFGEGGLLSNMDDWYKKNAATGQNDTMRYAQNWMRGLLMDPGVTQGLANQHNQGVSLMNTQVAGNPFWKPFGG